MSPERQAQIFAIIGELAEELGWIIAIPLDGEEVPGLILGTDEFISNLTNGENVEVYEKNDSGGSSSGTVH